MDGDKPFGDRGADNQHVADDAVNIGDFPEKEKSPKSGEKHLRIVKNRDFPGRRVGVGRGDGQ